jgi:hypothetical protein
LDTQSVCHCSAESKRSRIRRVKHWQNALAVLAALSASLALADDFKTTTGKEYKNVTVSHVESDGIVLKSKTGITKVYFIELPKEVQERFGYDAAKIESERAAEDKRIEEQRAADRERAEKDKPALDQPTVKTSTIRSEAERGFNAASTIGYDLSIIDELNAGQSVLDRAKQANTDTDAFKMGVYVGLYFHLKYAVPLNGQEAGFKSPALGGYVSEAFGKQATLKLTDAQMDEIFSDRIMALMRADRAERAQRQP